MKLAIMQPYIFPYIGYFQLIKAVDKFVIYDDVNFINRGWINRNRILVNGKDSLFTIPLKEASQNKLINEIEVNWDDAWKSKWLKTLEQSYKKAPFFQQVKPIIEQTLGQEKAIFSEIIVENLKLINAYLGIITEIIPSSAIYQNIELKAQNRILDICLQEKANHYINPIGGIELYQKEVFEEKGMRLNFIKSKPVQYPQLKNEFVPWLSILDVLMFNSVEQIQTFLDSYELV
ncbi:WbqC family protein [Flectobacillus roseus]|uniref:WbqC family protein n=1 Tax=Flectobacillus roseus TaxID=502259 RepID=A0ABT6Y247_9BACT|nr:WbqC family protein [Flectobacillus roseus]MDI9857647.1 WbqC family protein [Flectobacillus roseus]